MHEITELEKRWFRYKLKRWLTPLVTIVVSVLAIASFYLVDFSQLFVKNPTQPNKIAVNTINNEILEPKEVETKNTQLTEENEVLEHEEVETKNTLFAEEDEIHESKKVSSTTESRQFVLQAYEPVINLPKTQNTTTEKKTSLEPAPKQQEAQASIRTPEQEVITTQSSATFERSDNQMNPQSIEQRFNETNNIRHAVFLAKYYYDNKDYEQSYKWAFTINQLDPISEEGWIYFAKSLYKLDRKDDAVQVLRSYLNHYRSSSAQETLRQIIQGVL